MCEKVCKNCPFLQSPQAFGYDEDAMEALDKGEIPACHAEVGVESIFAHAPFEPENPCIGHRRWLEGKKGYGMPKLASWPEPNGSEESVQFAAAATMRKKNRTICREWRKLGKNRREPVEFDGLRLVAFLPEPVENRP